MAKDREAADFLIADNDPTDRVRVQQALEQHQVRNGVRFVEDGDELMDYLHCRGKYSDPASSPRPGVILLDLNMPRKDGRQAMEEIKADPDLRNIPVVVMTNSKEEEDMIRSFNLGVNAYITKPVTFDGLAGIIKTLAIFWFGVDQLPNGANGD